MMLGANVEGDGVRFTVWAPKVKQVEVVIDEPAQTMALESLSDGMHEGFVRGVGAGARYGYRLDGAGPFPDPVSRFQPDGVHGPSEVIDPSTFAWTDDAWPGLTRDGQVYYELHVGTFTPEGTYDGVIGQLKALKDLGITAIELMPVATCPGRWNWGYDGVNLYAPTPNYGRPDDLRHLIDAAHSVGLGVILDVVYNHLGPDGNYLGLYSDDYTTDRHQTPWGEAINYDDVNARHVRDYMIANACMWIREYHFDGFRLDATDTIEDESEVHLLQELTEAVRREAGDRSVVVIAENALNDVRIINPVAAGGYGLDGVWADDFHHSVIVSVTGAHENYYADYLGAPTEIVRAIEEGFLYQGEETTTGVPRGTTVTDQPASSFVFNIQNHDQVGNRPFGERLSHQIDRGRYAATTAVLLFAPETPLIFMGQEFAASTPFYFFSDHNDELGPLVTEGRRKEFAGFRVFQRDDVRALIPDPQDPQTFRDCILDLTERERHGGTYRWYQDLLRLRREDPVLRVQDRNRTEAVPLAFPAIAVRRWTDEGSRLLIANLGPKLDVPVAKLPGVGQESASSELTLLLESTAARYDGDLREALTYERNGQRWISVPARSASIWAFGGTG